MTVIISGNDYVLYSMLKVSNVSLNIILRNLYSYSESNNRYFSSDLENKLKQTCGVLKLWTHCEQTRVFHNKDCISHSLTQNCSVHSHLNHLFSVSTFLFFTLAMFLLLHRIYTGLDKALQITWTLCQYVINRTRHQRGFLVSRRIQCRQHHWL